MQQGNQPPAAIQVLPLLPGALDGLLIIDAMGRQVLDQPEVILRVRNQPRPITGVVQPEHLPKVPAPPPVPGPQQKALGRRPVLFHLRGQPLCHLPVEVETHVPLRQEARKVPVQQFREALSGDGFLGQKARQAFPQQLLHALSPKEPMQGGLGVPLLIVLDQVAVEPVPESAYRSSHRMPLP